VPPVVTLLPAERSKECHVEPQRDRPQVIPPGGYALGPVGFLVENLFIRRFFPVTANSMPFPIISSCQKGLPRVYPTDEWKGKCYANWETSL
jgi:hypothetical protein